MEQKFNPTGGKQRPIKFSIGRLTVIVMLCAIVTLCLKAEIPNVLISTKGPLYHNKPSDVFAVRYYPEAGFNIHDVVLHGDLAPFLLARIDKGDYWVFLFDQIYTDGKFYGVEAMLIKDVGVDNDNRLYHLRPYWDNSSPCALQNIEGMERKQGCVAYPPNGSGSTCFGWKMQNIVTNYTPIICRTTGKPFLLGDLSMVADAIPCGAILAYGEVQTNIIVRLDAKWK